MPYIIIGEKIMENNKRNTVWAILGVSEDARIKAKIEAKKQRKNIGEWVEDLINGIGDSTNRNSKINDDNLSHQLEALDKKIDHFIAKMNNSKRSWFAR